MFVFKMWGSVCSIHPKKIIIAYFVSTLLPLLLRHHVKVRNANEFVMELDDSLATALIALSLFLIYKRIEKIAAYDSKMYVLMAVGYTLAVLVMSFGAIFYLFNLRGKRFYNSFMVLGYVMEYNNCIALLKSSAEVKNVVPGMSNLSPEITLNTIIACMVSLFGIQFGNAIISTFSWYLIIGVLANYIVWMTLYPTILTLLLKKENFTKNFVTKIKNTNTIVETTSWLFTIKLILIKLLLLVYIYKQRYLFKMPVAIELSELILSIIFILTNTFIFKLWMKTNNLEENKFVSKSADLTITSIDNTEILSDELYSDISLQRSRYSENENVVKAFKNIPYKLYDYSKVNGACCENVIGYIPIPLGIVGPLLINGYKYFVPLATTEGCLVASASRGCRALLNEGVTSRVCTDGMTRGPVLRFENGKQALKACNWIDLKFDEITKHFNDTSRFINLIDIQKRLFGRLVFLRFNATTGDAMGMNMISQATDAALKYITKNIPYSKIVSLSGNFCTDKKSANTNWILGRGKGVFAEAIIKAKTLKEVLKTTAKDLVDINTTKNLIGSAAAGCVGGFNAHASNIVTAIFAATGQDIAQNVVSSNCMTIMELSGEEDLYVSCTLPSLEVGTIGGGTELGPQSACLQMMGIKGGNEQSPGKNSRKLAEIISGVVLAAELSLLSALVEGNLVDSHLKLNRHSN